MSKNEAIVQYFGQPMKVACDRNCEKAWGFASRPHEQLSDDPDDIVWLADSELAIAPADPGTYEGGYGKPASPNEFPNKWCVRQCERCNNSKPEEWERPLALKNWEQRIYNFS